MFAWLGSMRSYCVTAAGILLLASPLQAFTAKMFYAGIGYFSENSMGKITKSSNSEASTLGTVTYPVLIRYDWELTDNIFFAPTLTYTWLNRKSAGDVAEVNIWHLMLPFGRNFRDMPIEWYAGPGLLNRTFKGSGGTTQLNNGTSTATFVKPSRTVEARLVTLNLGLGVFYGSSRFAFDATAEGFLSTKRTYDFMLSYAYGFGGGL